MVGQIDWESSQKVRNILARTHAHTQAHTLAQTCTCEHTHADTHTHGTLVEYHSMIALDFHRPRQRT